MELSETDASPQMSLWQHLEKYFAKIMLVTCSGFFFPDAVLFYSQVAAQVPQVKQNFPTETFMITKYASDFHKICYAI